MLFFIDESWQTTNDKKYKVGILSAVSLSAQKFNDFSYQMYNLKIKHLGRECGNIEIKGNSLLKKYFFRLETKNILSNQLSLAREIFVLAKNSEIKVFASVVFEKKEIDLACADVNQLERPFFFLFERMNQFMKENYPDAFANLVFDDRGIETNKRISKSVSNFFHKSQKGRSFERIIKAPLFAISNENVGIQLADVVGHVIGRRFTGDQSISEFFKYIKELQFKSIEFIGKDIFGKGSVIWGIKVVKEKGAGELTDQE